SIGPPGMPVSVVVWIIVPEFLNPGNAIRRKKPKIVPAMKLIARLIIMYLLYLFQINLIICKKILNQFVAIAICNAGIICVVVDRFLTQNARPLFAVGIIEIQVKQITAPLAICDL
ncbi:MAG TPA: hypothetical protein O0X50_01755, partial [Methanocorpusculum sp.]|nr:hypothetical protein [Methanocorpusculum sp.]